MHLDPNSSILKAHGKYAGPLSEYEVSVGKKEAKLFTYQIQFKKGGVYKKKRKKEVGRKKRKVAKPPGRIELPTPGLRDQCSTTEL